MNDTQPTGLTFEQKQVLEDYRVGNDHLDAWWEHWYHQGECRQLYAERGLYRGDIDVAILMVTLGMEYSGDSKRVRQWTQEQA